MRSNLYTAILTNSSIATFSEGLKTAIDNQLSLTDIDSNGMTLLKLAAREGDFLKVWKLLEADVDADDPVITTSDPYKNRAYYRNHRTNAFEFALTRGHTLVAILLMISGAKVTPEESQTLRNHPGYVNLCAGILYTAVAQQSESMLLKIRDYIAADDALKSTLQTQINALIAFATSLKNLSIINRLLTISNCSTDKNYHAALYWACLNDDTTLAERLIAQGADEKIALTALFKEDKGQAFDLLYRLLTAEKQKEYVEARHNMEYHPPILENELATLIFNLAEKNEQDALTTIHRSNEIKPFISALKYAFDVSNFVVIHNLLKVPFDQAEVFCQVATDNRILAIFCTNHYDMRHGIAHLAGHRQNHALLSPAITMLWTLQGSLHAMMRQSNTQLFHTLLTEFSHDAPVNKAKLRLRTVLHFIEDNYPVDMQPYLSILQTRGVDETIEKLKQRDFSLHLSSKINYLPILMRYRVIASNDPSANATLVPEDIWKSILHDYIAKEDRVRTTNSLARSCTFFRDAIHLIDNKIAKHSEIDRKKNAIAEIAHCLELIDDKTGQLHCNSRNPMFRVLRCSQPISLSLVGTAIWLLSSHNDSPAAESGEICLLIIGALASLTSALVASDSHLNQTGFTLHGSLSDAETHLINHVTLRHCNVNINSRHTIAYVVSILNKKIKSLEADIVRSELLSSRNLLSQSEEQKNDEHVIEISDIEELESKESQSSNQSESEEETYEFSEFLKPRR